MGAKQPKGTSIDKPENVMVTEEKDKPNEINALAIAIQKPDNTDGLPAVTPIKIIEFEEKLHRSN